MALTPDHLPPRRTERKRTNTPASEPPPIIVPPGPDLVLLRRIRIAAILLGLFAVLLLVALLTYTTRDEINAQLTSRDLLGVVRGDEAVRVRFETTHNWLGLLGALISHWFYTATVGVWSVGLPIMLFFWAHDFFKHYHITPLVRRRSVSAILSMVCLAAIVGTLQQIPWMFAISVIFSGAIGQFLAGVLTQFIGTIGSFIVWLAAFSFVLFFGWEIRPLSLTEKINNAISWTKFNLGKATTRNKQETHPEYSESEDTEVSAATVRTNETDNVKVSKTYVRQAQDSPVTIVRPMGTAAAERSASGATPGKQTPSSDTPSKRLDLEEVKRRLEQLHADDQKSSSHDKGPKQPGDTPELPLFLGDDPDEVEVPDVVIPQGGGKPLVVNVEVHEDVENEVQLSNATLYDEEIAYKPPTLALLVEGTDEVSVDDEELRENARILQEKLETFRIKIENLTVQPGPVVTQYEFVPASGIKVSQIESLADDIALALKAPAVRIQAPVPGKGTVGIEIPNHNPALVRFSSVIKSPKYHNPDIKLPIALGKTAVGEVYCADLTKMPHLLIAGATGKGKSVGINTLIASLVFRMHPRDLKFVIIDPKRVEMSLYRELRNHYLAISPDIDETIITEPINAVAVLKSVVEEMQQRYNILASAGQRNIADYNRKVKEGRIKEKDGYNHRPMPYIVVVIDELADLMMTAGKEVEEPIVRLAQLARAVGIHCVVATQRPSVDVVTGLIKANFPARIAYQVSARVDSRTILDTSGAEHLIGNGDMLFAPGNTPKPLRMQNAFISTEEVEALCEHIGKQRGYKQPYVLPSILQKKEGGFGRGGDDRDALFEDAARIFIQLQQASVSTLQRRLKVGYARAARIVDELESAGIVGPPDGSKGRSVLLQSESELEAYI